MSIRLLHNGIETEIAIAEGTRLVDACLALDRCLLPVGCRKGACGTCLVRVTDGVFGDRTPREERFLRDRGLTDLPLRLACQITPQGPMRIETPPLGRSSL